MGFTLKPWTSRQSCNCRISPCCKVAYSSILLLESSASWTRSLSWSGQEKWHTRDWLQIRWLLVHAWNTYTSPSAGKSVKIYDIVKWTCEYTLSINVRLTKFIEQPGIWKSWQFFSADQLIELSPWWTYSTNCSCYSLNPFSWMF